MHARRIDSRLFVLALSLALGLLFVSVSSLLPPPAHAGPLDGVTGPVNEVTAPVQEVVEEVVPPVPPPPQVSEPPPVEAPEIQEPAAPTAPPVKAPEAPVNVPAPQPVTNPVSPSAGHSPKVVETAKDTVDAGKGTATDAGGTVTSAGKEVAGTMQGAAGKTTAGVRKIESSTTGRSPHGPAPSGSSSRPTNTQGASATPGAAAQASAPQTTGGRNTPQALDDHSPAAFAGIPARLLHPFIHVWPAVALLVEGPLGNFVGNWSRSVVALLEANGTGSLRGEAGSGAALAEAASVPQADDGQPLFSSLSLPSVAPFNWLGSGAALPALVFFLLLAAATLAIVLIARRELGVPLVPRRIRRWRR